MTAVNDISPDDIPAIALHLCTAVNLSVTKLTVLRKSHNVLNRFVVCPCAHKQYANVHCWLLDYEGLVDKQIRTEFIIEVFTFILLSPHLLTYGKQQVILWRSIHIWGQLQSIFISMELCKWKLRVGLSWFDCRVIFWLAKKSLHPLMAQERLNDAPKLI